MSSYKIIYNGTEYPVNKDLVELTSRVLRKSFSINPDKLVIEGRYPNESFETFLKAIQAQDFTTTIENCQDLIDLAEEYKCVQLLNILQTEAIEILSPENVLQNCLQILRENKPITRFEPLLAKNLSTLIRSQYFLLVPVDVLDRVFTQANPPPENQGDVIRFFEALVTLKRPKASTLFKHIVFEKLGYEELEHVLNIPNVNKLDFIDQIADVADKLIVAIASEKESNGNLIRERGQYIENLILEQNEIKGLNKVLDHHLEIAQKRAKATRSDLAFHQDKVSSREMRCQVLKLKLPPVKPPGKPPERKPSKYVQWANAGFPKGGPVSKRDTPSGGPPPAQQAVSITIEPPKVKTAAPPPPTATAKPASPMFPERGTFQVERPTSPQVRVEKPSSDGVNVQRPAIKIERPTRNLKINLTK